MVKGKRAETSKRGRDKHHKAEVWVPDPQENYTAENLQEMHKTWARGSFAAALEARALAIEKTQKAGFVELGLIAFHMEKWELWKELQDQEGVTYGSFDRWMSSAPNGCRSNRYAALKAMKELQDVPAEVLKSMPRGNVKKLARVDKTERTPEVIKAATTLDEPAFDGYVERECPNSHLEKKTPMRLSPERSQRKVINTAIEAVMLLNPEVTSREDAVEILAIEYMESHQTQLEAVAQKAGRPVPQAVTA